MKSTGIATPTITGSLDTPAEKVKTSKALVNAIKACPDYVPGSDLDVALNDFLVATNQLETDNQGVAEAHLAVDVALSDQASSLIYWGTRKRGLLAAARIATKGSPQVLKSFGFGVLDPQEAPSAVAPENLRRRRSKQPGIAAVTWDRQPGVHTYMVQHATDLNDPSTFSAPRPSSRVSFALAGQTPGALVYFRVYAIDPRLPTGQTDYCAWLAVRASV